MPLTPWKQVSLSDRDLEFLVETVSPGVSDRIRLRQIIREDDDFRKNFITSDKVFQRLMDDDEILLKISPHLFFEILLRRAGSDLSRKGYTLERDHRMRIPVFDTRELLGLLSEEAIVNYLADMLSSFTRVQSYAVSLRIRKGIWRKIRFNDLDIFSLMALCDVVEEELRFGLYKRIADICLFMLGMFEDYVALEYRYPVSRKPRPQLPGRPRISPQDYETEGRRFYKLAAEHPASADVQLSEIFSKLSENFRGARKPLNFIADNYLLQKRSAFFV
jgi:hypothetical protein